MKSLSLGRLKNTKFSELFKKLALEKNLTDIEYKKLLSLAIIFINEKDENIFKLGYRIIVFYSNQTKDYRPLYDISINKGLYPVVKSIEKIENYRKKIEESFFKLFNASFGENYKDGDIYLSEQQTDLYLFFQTKDKESVSVIAPTSYGKSELIISTLKQTQNRNTCIVVPTKALIAQTKKRIIEADISNIKKIITHPEMFLPTDEDIIVVLTQERLLRLLRKERDLKFDIVFVDEAHNLLENNERSILLAIAISILKKRNENVKFKFLTPFLVDSNNLLVRYAEYNTQAYKINEYMKTERLYIYDHRKDKKLKLYDQFLNEFYYDDVSKFADEIDFIIKKSKSKNIIYLNKPVDIEKFSLSFSNRLPYVVNDKIQRAVQNISSLLDPDYSLIHCLKKGFIYHHGSVPDNLRLYIENLYSELEELRFIVTSSTLLEGVNIPAVTLYLLDNKKGRSNLSPSQFKNLIGRICRFSELFSPSDGDLKNLEPTIYLVGSNYTSSNANLDKFIKDCMRVDKKEVDNVTNVLLEQVEITSENQQQKEDADEFIENFEPGVIEDYNKSYAQTEIGKLCFINNITEIDIISKEKQMQKILDLNRNVKISTSNEVFELFSILFLPYVKNTDNHNNLRRLSYIESRNFYKMFLDWRIRSASYREMISSFLRYWRKIEIERAETDVFVGKWGDKTKNGFRELWTDIKTKSHKERVNLAIVRIKEEQDFIDNIFIKYIEVLNDLKLLQPEFYERIKYGTSDKNKITLIKNGLSLTVSNLLMNKYKEFLDIDTNLNNIIINPDIIKEMQSNNENEILIYEVVYNTKVQDTN
ncbi:DEAD/DEAH box helicase [Bacillus velezensis]|uniref:DEAD/DEAH box helicase n=2 Tax=Bacillus TaxID=1386 RepID=UPI0015F63417|nr:DEAD/DEAH box helicase [Bacillus velezensis]MCV2523353.1 DEAD/DEAH box helicase [Bacillus velezensis]MEC0383542.1 DEAD/DEAH box helicase [Bacillus velezensis]MEC0388337.1 DEAD/DEAH box helicase [Bacillus velezensis]MEC3921656.1 DEAD/DEAH box helicase [Bacillus velezensis]QMT24770.1 DEAD/DEAH box helicase [Bacillus velezensis]